VFVVSKYTANGRYPQFADRLRESCVRHGLPCDVAEVQPPPGVTGRQAWLDVMHAVPNWIINALCQRRGPVLYLDADCEIVEYPALLMGALEGGHDFAIYNWHADPQALNGVPYDPTRLLGSGGVIYFNYTAAALELLMRWVSNTPAHRDLPCDQVLDIAFNGSRGLPLRPLWLPKSYNRMTSHFPDVRPVINHVYVNGGHREENAAEAVPTTGPESKGWGWKENAKPIGLICNRCQKLSEYAKCQTETTAFGEVPICEECRKARDGDEAKGMIACAPPLRGVQAKLGAA